MDDLKILPQHADHPRNYRENLYVYPVLSRRSKGISVGVNLNPDKICNFDCIYCQVDRTTPATIRDVDVQRLMTELEATLDWVQSGALFDDPAFQGVPQPLRRLNDIAFSGDGEPTTEPQFPEIVERTAELKAAKGLDSAKIVLITNATMFHRPKVRSALSVLMANQGEIWAKLDAGSEEYYKFVERTKVPFRRVLDNIAWAAAEYPLVIQSMFLRHDGQAPTDNEIGEFIQRLREVIDQGGRIKLVQVYTVARMPAESSVTPLSDAQVDAIAGRVQDELGVPAETYYGGL